ncbi:MAG TPA: hypothetical protein PLO67_17130 [Saprospiraceae bacterium]|nr:hypothetical protein [Saprospiraceae bacterium]HPI06867.1 hypothetical protein [Saprospiraceae bacterium]
MEKTGAQHFYRVVRKVLRAICRWIAAQNLGLYRRAGAYLQETVVNVLIFEGAKLGNFAASPQNCYRLLVISYQGGKGPSVQKPGRSNE